MTHVPHVARLAGSRTEAVVWRCDSDTSSAQRVSEVVGHTTRDDVIVVLERRRMQSGKIDCLILVSSGTMGWIFEDMLEEIG